MKADGIRICVMRRIKPEYDFDVWMPIVAPPESLLKKYVIDKKMTWKEFVPLYEKKVLGKNIPVLQWMKELSKYKNVTLLCWEKSAHECHRSLILKAIKSL